MSRPVLYTILTSFFFSFFFLADNPFGAPELPKKTILGGIFSPSEFLIIDESKVAPTNPIKKGGFLFPYAGQLIQVSIIIGVQGTCHLGK